MADKDAFGAPQIQDKRTAPAGILPKSTQAWVIGGLAVVMVTIITFSGPPRPRENAKTIAPAPVDPNAARIEDFEKRIEEQTRRLEQEQADLAKSERGLDATAAARGRGNGFMGPSEENSWRAQPARGGLSTDEQKREYESLFASNVALSYRKEAQKAPPTSDASLESLAKLIPLMAALSALQQGTSATDGAHLPLEASGSEPEKTRPSPKEEKVTRPGEYRIHEGTVIETVLTNRLDSEFSGPVNCMVTTPVYSPDGQHVLVPAGSRVLGSVRPVNSFGQQRLAVVFHRLIMPDGYSRNLHQFQGLNQIGETGLVDKVNRHYWQVFGVSIAIGAIAGLGYADPRTGSDLSALDAYQQGVTSSLSQSSLRILDRYLNVLPTHTIREGHRVKIYLADDMILPAYDRHGRLSARPEGF